MLLLHPAAKLGWTTFTVHASTVLGIAALGAAYAWRARRGPSALDLVPIGSGASRTTTSRTSASHTNASHTNASHALNTSEVSRTDAGPTPAQRAAFFGSLALLFLTLNGPLHDLSDYYLFSAHMVQHLILTLIVPPLLVLGTPGWMLRPLLRNPVVFAIAKRFTTISASFVLFNVVLAAWHLPPLYNTAMAYHPVHIMQHLMFIAAAVLMWWPITSPLPELPRAAYPAQMLYCFLMSVPMSIISIYIFMADTLLYPAYAIAPRLYGITPLMDQKTGALVMWIPGGLFFYLVMTVVFFKWAARGEDDAASAQVDWHPVGN